MMNMNGVGVKKKLDNWRCNVETFDVFAIKKRSRFLSTASLSVTVRAVPA